MVFANSYLQYKQLLNYRLGEKKLRNKLRCGLFKAWSSN